MQILKSRQENIAFYQVYLTKEELQNKEIQKKIDSIKRTNARVAIFESGNNEFSKILKEIIVAEVEKVNDM